VSLLLYAVADASSDAITTSGVGGRRLRAVGDGPLVAIVSAHQHRPQDATWASIRQYDAALEQLMSTRAILPARFGSLLADATAAESLLAERENEWRAGLDDVRGAVELGIRTAWHRANECRHESGSAYMRSQLELRRRAREVAATLEPLAMLARASRCAVFPRPDTPMRAAYLLDRERSREFASLVSRLDSDLAGIDLVCTGPWPPYSFSEGIRT
jgi:hypothetical protein